MEVIGFQWGHDITVVVTIKGAVKSAAEKAVSMGPRHYSRGNERMPGMRYLTDGVSMGPRHYSRGNGARFLLSCLSTGRFNGATTLQSW